MIAIHVQKESETESNLSLIKRFSRRLKDSKILNEAKARRYTVRPLSFYKRKKQALKRLTRRTEIERLIKLGLMNDTRYKKS
ncbi:MAG: hypothetical protein AAB677_00410 [Patescibacteria group bacterium]